VECLVTSFFFREKQEQHNIRFCHRFQHSCLNLWQNLMLYWARKRPQRCEAEGTEKLKTSL